jgi:hypothetical protein
MAQQQLDLLKLSTGRSTQFGACAAKVVRRDSGNADFRRVESEHLPNDLLAQVVARNAARTVDRAENVAGGEVGSGRPGVNGDFHPGRHRRGPNATVLSNKVNDAPTTVALLDMRESDCRHFRSPQPAPEKDS